MKNLIVFSFLFFIVSFGTQAQVVSGYVFETEENTGKLLPLPGANVVLLGLKTGTITDINGKFQLQVSDKNSRIVVTYIGFKSDTLLVQSADLSKIILTKGSELNEVSVTAGRGGSYVQSMNPVLTTVISKDELEKLPCCNLAESFENNASVDVNYSDAVSGARQIQMLGLAGVYSQLLAENMPFARGVGSAYGLSYIPGSWMESIQVSKGISTVVNGYESITGQINVEYLKPHKADLLNVNLFTSTEGRVEANVTSAYKLNDDWSTMLLAHGSTMFMAEDKNKDSFADMPVYKQINVMNRWYYTGKYSEVQLGARFIADGRVGGQAILHGENEPANTHPLYETEIDVNRFEAFAKLGYRMPNYEKMGLGSQYSFVRHQQDMVFGHRYYKATQNSVYTNFMLNTMLVNTRHDLTAGVSFIYDDLNQQFNDSVSAYAEYVPGAFVQYTYNIAELINVIVGGRIDLNSKYGVFYTPRIHAKYHITPTTVLRISGGKGYRMPYTIPENLATLASSRTVYFEDEIKPEEAWNYGVSINQTFEFSENRNVRVGVDFYRTNFENQMVVNLDRTARAIYFGNLHGESYSNSFQTDLTVIPHKSFEINGSLRWNDVKVTIDDKLVDKPFSPRFKALLAFSYKSRFDKWQFDVTNQYYGESRVPSTQENPLEYQRNTVSDPYYILHFQVTRRFKMFEVYTGVENATDYTQPNPIIAADEPFGEYFDSSQIWGPMSGRVFYAGFRFKIK